MPSNTLTYPSNDPESSGGKFIFNEGGVQLLMSSETIIGSIDKPEYVEAISQSEDTLCLSVGFEIDLAASTIKSNREIAHLFGFEYTQDKVTSPSNSRLNDLRSTLVKKTEIHSGTFVDHPGGFIEFIDFARYLSRREIPMAAGDPELTAHDNLFHRFGYAAMSEAVFSRFVDWSTKAVERNDEELAKKIIGAMDEITSRGPTLGSEGVNGDRFLASFYGEFMPPFVAGVRALRDSVAQRRTVRKLKSLGNSVK